MKKLLLPFLIALGLLTGCSEDFEVAAPYKPVIVIFGILNADDTAHYVRVQKAFLDETKSAIDMSKVADSNYFSQISVVMREVNGNNVIATTPLQRVDLNNEGFPKQDGSFFTAPNYAYKFKPGTRLDWNRTYRIVVTNTTNGNVDSAETKVVNTDTSSSRTGNFYIDKFKIGNLAIDVKNITTGNQQVFTFSPPYNGRMFEGWFRFHYTDKNANNGSEVRRSIDWNFATDENGGRSVRLEVENSSVYTFLKQEIGPAPANTTRYLDSVDIFVYAGNVDMYNYKKITLNQQGGLTGDQVKPNYTNIKGSSGAIGMLASRAERKYFKAHFTSQSIDAIINDPDMRPLNIQRRP